MFGVGFIQSLFRWINVTDHAFKIRVINVQKVIEVHGSRIKSLDNISLIAMVTLNLLRNSINLNHYKWAVFVPFGIQTFCLYVVFLFFFCFFFFFFVFFFFSFFFLASTHVLLNQHLYQKSDT